jgi:hypothetical protein
MRTEETLEDSQFCERIAKVRARFASKLAEKIRATEAAMTHLAGDGHDTVAAVATVYRWFHDMYGISSTIGFDLVGQAARTLDAILVGPFRDRRGLRGDELAQLKEGLDTLRIAARTEMQPKDIDQEFKS